MNGIHLIGDLHDCQCPPAFLLEAGNLEEYCTAACQRHGLTVVGCLFHPFTGPSGERGGVTGAVVLAESHLAIHTWPEIASVTLDIYVCNFSGDNSARARALFREIIAALAPARAETKEVARGHLSYRSAT